jgi:YgiT-type zinc finger domain-containing protein
MKCISCGADTFASETTDVTELKSCLVIVRDVPCHNCSRCDETIYTGDVVRQLERIAESAKSVMGEITIMDFNKISERTK